MSANQYEWLPFSLNEVARLFSCLPVPWWIAGGVALELFAGFPIRQHEDIDVGIFRADQLTIQDFLSGWDLYEANASKLTPWMKGKFLYPGVNQIWCRLRPNSAWRMEIMFMELEEDHWFFRRAPQVRGPRSELIRHTADGIPYLSPQIQLLYKARQTIPAKDALDFATVLPFLNAIESNWLLASLKIIFPDGHPWIDVLSDPGERSKGPTGSGQAAPSDT